MSDGPEPPDPHDVEVDRLRATRHPLEERARNLGPLGDAERDHLRQRIALLERERDEARAQKRAKSK